MTIYITSARIVIGEDGRDGAKGEKLPDKLRFRRSSWLGYHIGGPLFYGGGRGGYEYYYVCIRKK